MRPLCHHWRSRTETATFQVSSLNNFLHLLVLNFTHFAYLCFQMLLKLQPYLRDMDPEIFCKLICCTLTQQLFFCNFPKTLLRWFKEYFPPYSSSLLCGTCTELWHFFQRSPLAVWQVGRSPQIYTVCQCLTWKRDLFC